MGVFARASSFTLGFPEASTVCLNFSVGLSLLRLGAEFLFQSLYALLLGFKGIDQGVNYLHPYRSILAESADLSFLGLQFVLVRFDGGFEILDAHLWRDFPDYERR